MTLVEIGMIPSVFVGQSHISFNLSIALPLWMGGMIFTFFKSWKKALAHFVPPFSPMGLIPALVLIETLSSMIRPFTLSVRLMANIMAGHLIMTLVGSGISNLSSKWVWICVWAETGLTIFEMSVSLIQAYVFATLYFNFKYFQK